MKPCITYVAFHPVYFFFLPLVFFSPGGVVSEHNLHFSSERELLFPRMSEKDISYHIFGVLQYSIARSIDLRGAFPTTPIVLVDNRREFPPVKNKAETGVSTSFYSIQRIKMFLLIFVISCSAVVYTAYTLLNVCLIFILVGIHLHHWIHWMTVPASFI